MKSISIRFSLFFATVLLVVGCSVFKGKESKTSANKSDFNKDFVIEKKPNPFFKPSEGQQKWVDSVYKQMSFEERIGQLFMVAAYSNKDTTHTNAIEKLIKDYKVGGLIF